MDYFGARYYRAGIGRFTTVDPVMTIDENLVDPQRWNRYAYARNNPLRWVDPNGETIAVSANEQDRRRLEADTRDALGDAGQFVTISWDKSAERWQYAISGISMDEFRAFSESAAKFGDLVQLSSLLWVKVTSERLKANDAAFTFDIRTRGNADPVVALNYARENNMISQSQHWAWINRNFGPDVDARAVRPLTMGIALFHELGHAWGNVHGRRTLGGHTWREAIDWEDAARRTTYPLGPNAMRRWHR